MATDKNRPARITVVTPSFNQGRFLEKTILSVIEQGYPNLEYIIIDGGSTDESVAIIKKYEQYLAYWVSEQDQGQNHAINKGFARATGEILGWLNSDDLYCPGALQAVGRLNWHDMDFCYGEGFWIDADGDSLGRYPTCKPSKGNLYYRCTLCQPTVFFSKSVYESLGPLSTEIQNSFDYEYWLRAESAGKRFSYIPRLQALSRMHYQNKTLAQTDIVITNNSMIFEKYFTSGAPIGPMSEQRRVFVEEYTTFREKILFRSLRQKYDDVIWTRRSSDGWVVRKAVCLVRRNTAKDAAIVLTVYDSMLPVTAFISVGGTLHTFEFRKAVEQYVYLRDLNIECISCYWIKIVIDVEKTLVVKAEIVINGNIV